MRRVSGETDLERLLAGLDPVLHEGTYVFATVEEMPSGVDPVLTFTEAEGRTLIVSVSAARRAGLAGVFPSAWITVRIHSSLAAVGLLARITTALADAGISCNPVSAYYHDHLFVPRDRADEAMEVLRELGRG